MSRLFIICTLYTMPEAVRQSARQVLEMNKKKKNLFHLP